MKMYIVEEAIMLATNAHRGQKDKNGEPYILHPLRVMLKLLDPIEQAAAVLHDLIEDTIYTRHDLLGFEFPTRVVDLVECLTRGEDELYMDYLKRIATDPAAVRIKIADIEDNMPRPERPLPPEYKGLEKRYTKALAYLKAKRGAAKLSDYQKERSGGL